jgi:hypothetical protein
MTAAAAGLVVAGRGEATEANRSRFDAPAIVAIRYADPAAWITATAVANAMGPLAAAVAAVRGQVGVVVNSAEGPVEAIAAITEAGRAGTSSPIRYPASNPGSLGGLTSIAFGFQGPSLVLTMPAARGVPVGLLLAEAWLRRGVAPYVVVASCDRQGWGAPESTPRPARPVARCLLLAAPGTAAAGAPFDRERDGAWLAALPGEATEAP